MENTRATSNIIEKKLAIANYEFLLLPVQTNDEASIFVYVRAKSTEKVLLRSRNRSYNAIHKKTQNVTKQNEFRLFCFIFICKIQETPLFHPDETFIFF